MFVHVDVRPFDPLEARLGMKDCGRLPDNSNRNLLRKGSAAADPGGYFLVMIPAIEPLSTLRPIPGFMK
jgi:hypothetical protein